MAVLNLSDHCRGTMPAASSSPAGPRLASCALLHRPRTGMARLLPVLAAVPRSSRTSRVRRQRTESLTQSYFGITERTARLGSWCGFTATSRRVNRIMSPASPFPSNLQPSIRAGQTLTWMAVDSPEHARSNPSCNSHCQTPLALETGPRDYPHRAGMARAHPGRLAQPDDRAERKGFGRRHSFRTTASRSPRTCPPRGSALA